MSEQLSERGKDLVKYMPQAVNALADRLIEKLTERMLYGEKPLTNADRIRAMTDEELAGWLERIRLCCATDLCGRSCPFSEVCYSNAEEPKEMLDWLKQEAKR